VSTRRSRLEAADETALADAVLTRFGPHARLLEAERVTVPGFAGIFAKRAYDVVVDVPDGPVVPRLHDRFTVPGAGAGSGAGASAGAIPLPAAPTRAEPAAPPRTLPPAAGGLAALLEAADAAEARAGAGAASVPPFADAVHGAAPLPPLVDPVAGTVTVSTDRADFTSLLDDLAGAVAPEPPTAPVPVLRANPGDLVLVVGVGDAVLQTGLRMAGSARAELAVSGSLETPGARRLDTRRAAIAARAEGVERGSAILLAYALPSPLAVTVDRLAVLRSYGADQVWVVLDATRKPDDTRAWLAPVAAAVPITGAAAVGVRATATPDTVAEPGIPIGWVDGAPGGWPAGPRSRPVS
jgi:hypothetical protein